MSLLFYVLQIAWQSRCSSRLACLYSSSCWFWLWLCSLHQKQTGTGGNPKDIGYLMATMTTHGALVIKHCKFCCLIIFFISKTSFSAQARLVFKKFCFFGKFQSINHNEIYILAYLLSLLHETLLVFLGSASFGFCLHLNWFCS